MIVTWMLYATLVGALAFLGGVAAERAVAIWGGARRIVWFAALVVTALVPIALATRRPPLPSPAASTGAVSIEIGRAPAAIDEGTRTSWLVLSSLTLVLYVGAMLRMRIHERQWRSDELDGEPVLVAPNLGPAVIGILEPRVVIPVWAFELDVRSRRFMLRHEDEHIRAADPQLLCVAALTLVFFPWNPALWLIVARLRLAIEVDCDARVLLDGNEGGAYGALLLAVCARRGTSLPLAAALAEHTPDIERRIIAMTELRPRWALLSSSVFATLAAAAIALAAIAPRPTSLRPPKSDGSARLPLVRVGAFRTARQVRAVIPDTSRTDTLSRSRPTRPYP